MKQCVILYVYAGLEIGGVASQNTNHFWGICELLWQSESQNCESILADLRITFQIISQKRPFFGPHDFFRQNFPPFQTHFMYVIRNCESLCQSVSQNPNHFSFFKFSPA